MRRTLRALGTLMMLAGIGCLAWAFVVWRWEDPVTSVYTAWKQRGLASDLDRRLEAYTRRPDAPSLAAARQQLEADARGYRRSVRGGEAIGRINVPRLGVRMVMVYGTDRESLKRGPAIDPRTSLPGQGELVYIAGHRTTYSAPFSKIDSLRRGDRITIEMPYGTFVYSVTRSTIVRATEISVLGSRGREEVALQACHPRFFASHRWITYGRLTRVSLRSGASFAVSREAVG